MEEQEEVDQKERPWVQKKRTAAGLSPNPRQTARARDTNDNSMELDSNIFSPKLSKKKKNFYCHSITTCVQSNESTKYK